MKIQRLAIAQLLPAPYNPRKNLKPGDPEYEKIKRSMTDFGYIVPIVVNERNMHVVGGHQRMKVLEEMGETEIDAVLVEFNDEDERAANIALNKVQGEWDLPLLKDLLEELDAGHYDVSRTGFDEDEIEQLMLAVANPFDEQTQEDNYDPTEVLAEEEPITQPGDVWLLGDHRLLCGDSTKLEDVARLMAGEKADLIITDPPYNVDYEGGSGLKIQNDKMEDKAFYRFLRDAFDGMYESMAPGAGIYVFHSDSEGHNFRNAFIAAGLKLAQVCIWVKDSLVMGRQDYHWQHEPVLAGGKEPEAEPVDEGPEHEPVLYGWRTKAAHRWFSDRKQTTIWNFKRPKVSREHPTMKPIDLVGYPIKNSSRKGQIVADFFGGSGSTLIACEQLKRKCRTMELDPKYCDVIVDRWEKASGRKAERLEVMNDAQAISDQ